MIWTEETCFLNYTLMKIRCNAFDRVVFVQNIPQDNCMSVPLPCILPEDSTSRLSVSRKLLINKYYSAREHFWV